MSLFNGDGLWLRCALHAHTTNSDGEMAPDMLVRHFEWSGYDVLAITDHWFRTVERSTRKLLVIGSTELNARVGASGDDAHVLALGVEADPEPPDGEFAPLQEVVDWISEHGGGTRPDLSPEPLPNPDDDSFVIPDDASELTGDRELALV